MQLCRFNYGQTAIVREAEMRQGQAAELANRDRLGSSKTREEPFRPLRLGLAWSWLAGFQGSTLNLLSS